MRGLELKHARGPMSSSSKGDQRDEDDCHACPSEGRCGPGVGRHDPYVLLAAKRRRGGWVGGQLLQPADKPDRRVIVGTWRTPVEWEAWHQDPHIAETRRHPGRSTAPTVLWTVAHLISAIPLQLALGSTTRLQSDLEMTWPGGDATNRTRATAAAPIARGQGEREVTMDEERGKSPRSEQSATKLGERIRWLNVLLLAFTVAIFAITLVQLGAVYLGGGDRVRLYLRKSLRLGPLRVNLSTHGLGLSVGAKGARFGVDAGGHPYMHVGWHGVYVRKRWPVRRTDAGIDLDMPAEPLPPLAPPPAETHHRLGWGWVTLVGLGLLLWVVWLTG